MNKEVINVKYIIHAKLVSNGVLKEPEVIGAIFNQTRGLLGDELELQELQKEGKIGRVEVELKNLKTKTKGTIKIPVNLEQSETTLIGASIQTIEWIKNFDVTIEVNDIEDVRGSKRDYIIRIAKELMNKYFEK